jgi:hypothetical protein
MNEYKEGIAWVEKAPNTYISFLAIIDPKGVLWICSPSEKKFYLCSSPYVFKELTSIRKPITLKEWENQNNG